MTERKVKLDRANKSILLRALGDVYYGQRANGGSTEVTGRLILRVNDLPAGGKLTLSAAEYRLAKHCKAICLQICRKSRRNVCRRTFP